MTTGHSVWPDLHADLGIAVKDFSPRLPPSPLRFWNAVFGGLQCRQLTVYFCIFVFIFNLLGEGGGGEVMI